ncbi:dynamin family protein [Phormidesmis sp. 146-35]
MAATSISSANRSEATDILNQLLEERLQENEIENQLIFLAALAGVLVGVTFADTQVTDEEQQRLKQIVAEFIPAKSILRSTVVQMFQKVRQGRWYARLNELKKLLRCLSESECLLLLAFGYELAIADGNIDPRERQYLNRIADHTSLKSGLSKALELSFTETVIEETEEVKEVRYWLDPARFQALDPVFSAAASRILLRFPRTSRPQATRLSKGVSYETLATFQLEHQRLEQICGEASKIIQSDRNQAILPQIEAALAKISKRIRSQTFRIAVVGEFSQGKSTLLNALLGEEIQPVRAIPCSGVITVLRYGESRRVLCRYKDGREEEIPFEEYQEKSAISEEAALCNRNDELLRSGLEEIILEHPGLELCRYGVEIIDSPGLNEHPERENITRKLLKDLDAAIFLVNASRPLTMGERELLQSMKAQLNGGKPDQPAKNLFVLVNFMDLLRREKDRQQVQQLVGNFVYGEAAILERKNRLHFISAQAAIDAILDGEENEYLDSFRNFSQALEEFLIAERGALKVDLATQQVHSVLEESIITLQQMEASLDSDVTFSESEKQVVVSSLRKIYDGSIRLQALIKQEQEQCIFAIPTLWEDGILRVKYRVTESSKNWTSEQSENEKIAQDFSNFFLRDVTSELEFLLCNIQESHIKPHIEKLTSEIYQEIEAVQVSLLALDIRFGLQLNRQHELSLSRLDNSLTIDISKTAKDEAQDASLGGGVLGIGIGAVVAAATVGVLLAPAVLVGATVGGILGWLSKPDPAALRNQALQAGFQKLEQVEKEIGKQILADASSSFIILRDDVKRAFQSPTSALANLLAQREQSLQTSLEDREIEKVSIQQDITQLSEVSGRLILSKNQNNDAERHTPFENE